VKRAKDSAPEFARELLKQASANRAKLHSNGRKGRTASVANMLGGMAVCRRLDCCPNRNGKTTRRQFLWDFTWLKCKGGDANTIVRCELVVESEWNRPVKSILSDFRKLLIAKSKFKLCIYQLRSKVSSGEEVRGKTETLLASYEDHRSGEHYFLLEIDRRKRIKDGGVPKPRLFHWSPASDGRAIDPRFKAWS
jgi:hypothetical protein